MIEALKAYYQDNGILSTSFSCVHKRQCAEGCSDFTGPKSAFVSTGYESGKWPRLLFVSLDSGSSDKVDVNRLPEAVRAQEEVDRIVSLLPKNRHWYRTHELAWYILKHFAPELALSDAKQYFAHANSAKCCMNKAHSKKANATLFNNCKKYLRGELEILCPNVIVTQGNEAKEAILSLHCDHIKYFDDFSSIIQINNKNIFWLHTYHPNNWGKFNKQRNFNVESQRADGWVHYSNLIYTFIEENA